MQCYDEAAEAFGWARPIQRPGTMRDGDWLDRMGLCHRLLSDPASPPAAARVALPPAGRRPGGDGGPARSAPAPTRCGGAIGVGEARRAARRDVDVVMGDARLRRAGGRRLDLDRERLLRPWPWPASGSSAGSWRGPSRRRRPRSAAPARACPGGPSPRASSSAPAANSTTWASSQGSRRGRAQGIWRVRPAWLQPGRPGRALCGVSPGITGGSRLRAHPVRIRGGVGGGARA